VIRSRPSRIRRPLASRGNAPISGMLQISGALRARRVIGMDAADEQADREQNQDK